MLLFFVEIFVPSGGALLVGGLVCFVYSLYLFFSNGYILEGSTAVLFTVGYSVILVRFWVKKVKLTETLASSVATGEDVARAASLIGATGLTVTPLHPAGIAKINGSRFDVVTSGGYIEAGIEISVVEAAGNRIVVRRLNH